MINITYFQHESPNNLYDFHIGDDSYQLEPPSTWLDPWIVRPCTFDDWFFYRYKSFPRVLQFIKRELRNYNSSDDLECQFYFPLDKHSFFQALKDVPHVKEV